jgi:hypothetical protein
VTVTATEILLAKLTGQEIPRDEPRVRVRVTSLADGVIIAGVRFAAPPDQVDQTVPVEGTGMRAVVVDGEVYESDLPKLERQLEDKLDRVSVERVVADMRGDLEEWAAERVKGLSGADLAKAREAAERSFPGSFPGYFRRAFKRDLRPLVKIERVPEKTKKAA